jgi:hypothetical protein
MELYGRSIALKVSLAVPSHIFKPVSMNLKRTTALNVQNGMHVFCVQEINGTEYVAYITYMFRIKKHKSLRF